jgi:hypothetical protein
MPGPRRAAEQRSASSSTGATGPGGVSPVAAAHARALPACRVHRPPRARLRQRAGHASHARRGATGDPGDHGGRHRRLAPPRLRRRHRAFEWLRSRGGADQEPEWAPLRLSPMCAIVRRHRRPSNRSRCGSRCAGVRPRRTGRPSRPCGPSGTRTSDRTARSIPRCSSLPEVVRHRAEGPGSRDRRRCTVPRRRRLMPRHHDGRPTPRSVGTVAGTRPGCVAIRTSNDD